MSRRALLALILGAAALVAAPSTARPFTVDDLLHQETFRSAALDPSGRWLVYERTDPYDRGTRYDYDQQSKIALSRLKIVDLAHPGRARRLLAKDPGPGEVLGPFSPSGRRLAIFRLHGRRWGLGVTEVPSGKTRWFRVTPELPLFGRGLQWIDDRHLLVIDRPDGVPPFILRQGHVSADALPGRWAASASGLASYAIAGSGAYAAVRPRPTPRHLIVLDATTGAQRIVAIGEFTDVEVSPNAERAAVLEAGADLQSQPDQPSQGARGISTQTSNLRIVDLRSGRRIDPCPSCDALPNLLAWSPSGASLLVYVRAPRQLWTQGRLLRVTGPTGESEEVGGELLPAMDLRPEALHAGWMGESPVVLAQEASDRGGRFDWYRLAATGPINLTRQMASPPRDLIAIGPRHALLASGEKTWQLDEDGNAEPMAVAPGVPLPDAPPPPFRVAHAPLPSMLQLSEDRGPRQVTRLTPSGEQPLGLPSVGAGETVVAVSVPQRAIVTRRADAQGREHLYVRKGDRPPVIADEINSNFAAITPARIVRISHTGPDGQPLSSWLYLPQTAPGIPVPPLVIAAYSGDSYREPMETRPPERGLVTDIRPLVGHGYAVLLPSLPLPRTQSDPMAGLADRILAVLAAANADPIAAGRFDPDRVALWGHSYGGYTVMAAIGQTDRFRAAVAIAGFSDMTAMWSTLPVEHRVAPEEGSWSNFNTGNTESGQNRMGAPPWTDPARFARNSPLLAADRIHTPLLLLHGDQDLIPLSGSEAMFSALYRQDKDAMLVTYFGEGHILSSPGNVRDAYQRAFAFLDRQFTGDAKRKTSAPALSPECGPANIGPIPPPSPPTSAVCLPPSR